MNKPKYNYGYKVKFRFKNQYGETIEKEGTIYIIDEHGTFEQPGIVSYDILVIDKDGKKTLWKHISEPLIVKD